MAYEDFPLDKIRGFARANANADGFVETGVPGVRMMCVERGGGGRVLSTYRPLVCLVLQGAKSLLAGRQETLCRQGQSVIVSADLPVMGQIVEATPAQPYLALAIEFDMPVLSQQAELLGAIRARGGAAGGQTVMTQPTDEAMLDCGRRLLRLIDTPAEIPFLYAGLLQEIQYRLLTGPNGMALREVASAQSAASRLSPAIALLRARYREPIRIDMLANASAMSRAAFHRNFKSVTSTTPVQYQKRLRLIEARRLLRHEAASATKAAYEVGYESVPQFTRDYGGMFGVTPGRERKPE